VNRRLAAAAAAGEGFLQEVLVEEAAEQKTKMRNIGRTPDDHRSPRV
jgi:hypothetical protein